MTSGFQTAQMKKSSNQTTECLTLVLDESVDVALADKPIFGTTVTIREDVVNLVGKALHAGLVLGWLNYIDVSKFACITDGYHYVEAKQYFHSKQNQLIIAKPLVLQEVNSDMNKTKQLLRFYEIKNNVTNIS